MFRDWFRGFVVDPELEKKARDFVDRANSAAQRAERVAQKAEKLVDDANRKLRRLDPAETALIVSTVLVGAGIVMGTLMSKISKEEE